MTTYNVELIQRNIEAFKNRMDVPSIAFDCDNTLYRFSIRGHEEKYLTECYSRGFYKELPVFPEAYSVIENLIRLGIDVKIITHYMDTPFCKSEKEESIAYHFPMVKPENVFFLTQDTPKSKYGGDVDNTILVDDWGENVREWYRAGGVAVKKTYSGKKRPVPAVQSLIDIFSVLNDLNVLRRL